MSTTCIEDALISPIIDKELHSTVENIYGKHDQEKDDTLYATAITVEEKKISVGIPSNTDADQVTAQDQPFDVNVSMVNKKNELVCFVEAETLDSNVIKETIICKANVNVNDLQKGFTHEAYVNISAPDTLKENTVKNDTNAATGTVKKESVHFCSPIASYHEYDISQDSCTQPLSDIDESELSVTLGIIENSNEGFESKYNCQRKQKYAERSQANLMTPAGDCSNSLLIGRILEESKDIGIAEVQRRLESKINTVENNSQKDFETGLKKLDTNSLPVKKEELANSTENGLSCSNFSPDLFDADTNVSCDDSILTKYTNSQKLIESSNKIETIALSNDQEVMMTENVYEENDAPKNENETAQCTKTDLTGIADTVAEECLPDKTPVQPNMQEIDQEKLVQNNLSHTFQNSNNVCDIEMSNENDGSQDLFPDMESGNRSDCGAVKNIRNSELKIHEHVRLSQDILYCNESFDNELCGDSSSNKRELSSPQLYCQPSKKLKITNEIDIDENRTPKRVVPLPENDEEITPLKKMRFSELASNETDLEDSMFNPVALTSLAAGKLNCLKEDVLWKKTTGQNNKNTVLAVQFDATCDLVKVNEQKETLEENTTECANQITNAEENILEDDNMSVDTQEINKHNSNRDTRDKNKQEENTMTNEMEETQTDTGGAKNCIESVCNGVENPKPYYVQIDHDNAEKKVVLSDTVVEQVDVDTQETSKLNSNGEMSETDKQEENTITNEMEETQTDIDGANNCIKTDCNEVDNQKPDDIQRDHDNNGNGIVLSDTVVEQVDVDIQETSKHNSDGDTRETDIDGANNCIKTDCNAVDNPKPDDIQIDHDNARNGIGLSDTVVEQVDVDIQETSKHNFNGDTSETDIDGANNGIESDCNGIENPKPDDVQIDHDNAGNEVVLSDTVAEQVDADTQETSSLNSNEDTSETNKQEDNTMTNEIEEIQTDIDGANNVIEYDCYGVDNPKPDDVQIDHDNVGNGAVLSDTGDELVDVDIQETGKLNSNKNTSETNKQEDNTMTNEMEETQTYIDGANNCIESDSNGVDNPKLDDGQIDHDNAGNGVVLSDPVVEQVNVKRLIPQDFIINSVPTDAQQMCLKITDDVADIYELDLSALKFISGTEYLSQSSQGSSIGFKYEKNNSPEYLCDSQECRSLSEDTQLDGEEDTSDLCKEEGGPCETSHPTAVMVELAADTCTETEIDTETLDRMVSSAVDHLVPDEEISAEEHTEHSEDCSMFEKGEGVKIRYYSCDVDMCDEEDKPVCPPVDERDGEVPTSSRVGCFKWRYAPSCDDTDRPVSEVDMEETIVRITPMHTCNKPLRLGLSKKRQPLHRLHKF